MFIHVLTSLALDNTKQNMVSNFFVICLDFDALLVNWWKDKIFAWRLRGSLRWIGNLNIIISIGCYWILFSTWNDILRSLEVEAPINNKG